MANLSSGVKEHAAPLFSFCFFFAWAIFSSIYLSFQQPMLPVTNHFVAHTVWLFCCFLHILTILLHTSEHHELSQFETDVYYCSLQGISTVYLALKCDKTFLLYCMIFRCGSLAESLRFLHNEINISKFIFSFLAKVNVYC